MSVQRIKRGSVSVPVYRRKRWDGAPLWVVAWCEVGKKRQQRAFGVESKAVEFAKEKAAALAVAGAGALTLSGDAKARYEAALAIAEARGVTLDEMARQWGDSSALLPDGVRLMDAAREYADRHRPAECPSIEAIAGEMLLAKEAAGRSALHLRDLGWRLKAITDRIKMPLAWIRPSHVEAWLDSLEARGRNRANYLATLGSLVRFAENRGHIARGVVDLRGVEKTRSTSEIAILTPDALRRILAASPDWFRPFVALGAFAGLRTAEIERLEWSQIGREHIEIKAAQAKTRSRRIVPVLPALDAWIDRKTEGKVFPLTQSWNTIARVAEKAGVEWPRNALRHSFASYRLADTGDENRTAMEMGNSPAMIVRHYRAVVTPEQALEWFGVRPEATTPAAHTPTAP